MVTTVGLFGAIAVFPFASAQARRSRIFDMLAAAGRSAFHDFDARGMRRPDMWVAWDQSPGAPASQGFMPAMSVSNKQIAESYCIDPRMIAAHTTYVGGVPKLLPIVSSSGNPGGQCVQYFPYVEPYVDGNNNGFMDGSESMVDLNGNGGFDPPQFNPLGKTFDSSLMRRITLRQTGNSTLLPSYNTPMSLAQANAIFKIDDDLTYDRPESDKSLAATQSATAINGVANTWGRRQTDGKISWLATLVPKFDISGLPSDEYTLSVVMLYDRPNDLDILDNKKERVVNGVWQSAGATGGEIYLTGTDIEQLKVRPNDWVMVSGSYYVSQLSAYVTRFQWYRISDCDPEPVAVAPPGVGYELYATLIGQDWNMSFLSPPAGVGGSAPGKVRVTIVAGAFAVYEKTVRLDYGSAF